MPVTTSARAPPPSGFRLEASNGLQFFDQIGECFQTGLSLGEFDVPGVRRPACVHIFGSKHRDRRGAGCWIKARVHVSVREMISEIADGMEPVNPVRKCCPLRRRILFIRQVIHDPFDPIFAMPTPQLLEFRFGEAVFQKRKDKVIERAEVDQEKADG